MAKILCSISGLEFSCEHFPISLSQREYHHPIFSVPPKRLYKYIQKFHACELTEIDSYLLFLAYLKSTDLVEFRCAARRTSLTSSIVSANMDRLLTVISQINEIKHPSLSLVRTVVSKDTCDLGNVKYWIDLWDQNISDFKSGLKDREVLEDINKKANGLERLIKNPAISPKKYSHLLAEWASVAASFPTFTIILNGTESTCAEYWKIIIQACYDNTSIIQIPPADLQELIDHVHEYIDISAGSIQSHHLFKCLDAGKEKLQSFFGLGDYQYLSSDTPAFRILDANTSVEDANIQILIDTAPSSEPKRNEYQSEFAFMKAKFKWEVAQKYKTKDPNNLDSSDNKEFI